MHGKAPKHSAVRAVCFRRVDQIRTGIATFKALNPKPLDDDTFLFSMVRKVGLEPTPLCSQNISSAKLSYLHIFLINNWLFVIGYLLFVLGTRVELAISTLKEWRLKPICLTEQVGFALYGCPSKQNRVSFYLYFYLYCYYYCY